MYLLFCCIRLSVSVCVWGMETLLRTAAILVSLHWILSNSLCVCILCILHSELHAEMVISLGSTYEQ